MEWERWRTEGVTERANDRNPSVFPLSVSETFDGVEVLLTALPEGEPLSNPKLIREHKR